MTDRELLEAILKNMATKDDIVRLETKIEKGFADLMAMDESTQTEVSAIKNNLRTIEAVTAKNWNDILELKQAK